jgi:sugar phosphate isomerase/epimerase
LNPINRRTFLATGLLACAHTALGQPGAKPSFTFPTDPRHRIAIASYAFRAAMIAPANDDRVATLPGMDLPAFARYIRSEFNVYGIEPLHSHFPSTQHSEVLKLRAAFDAAGVRTVNIPVDARADLCSPDAAVRRQGYATYRKWVDIAVILGSPSVRISVPKCGGVTDVEGPANALRPVIDYASSQGIVLNLENDDPVYANEGHITKILNRVNNPWFGGLPDFGNSILGGDEEFNRRAVRSMFAHAINIAHVKGGEMFEGKWRAVSLPELFTIARQAQYKGFYSMESEAGDILPVADTKHLVEQSIALM